MINMIIVPRERCEMILARFRIKRTFTMFNNSGLTRGFQTLGPRTSGTPWWSFPDLQQNENKDITCFHKVSSSNLRLLFSLKFSLLLFKNINCTFLLEARVIVNGIVFNVLTWKFKTYRVSNFMQIHRLSQLYLNFSGFGNSNIWKHLIQMRLMLGPNEEKAVLKEFE